VLDEARAAVILNILEQAQRDGRDVGLVARQLFGSDDDQYAPYEMPCPSDQTWVRAADVSTTRIGGERRLIKRVFHREKKTFWSREDLSLLRLSKR
jgi:hypothetical protein